MKIPAFLTRSQVERSHEPPWVKETLANVEAAIKPGSVMYVSPEAYAREPSTEEMAYNLSRIADDLRDAIGLAEQLIEAYETQHSKLVARIENDLGKVQTMQSSLTKLRDSLPALPDGGEDEQDSSYIDGEPPYEPPPDDTSRVEDPVPINSQSSSKRKGLRSVPID